MKFIKPSEISGKILTLLDDSEEFAILVSPYIKISKWFKLTKKIQSTLDRDVPVTFYVRHDKTNGNSFDELNSLGFSYKSIKDLHCKVYLNERYAIVTSMNLLLSSEINSIEIGYRTETKEEYDELLDFVNRTLNINIDAPEDSHSLSIEDVCAQLDSKLSSIGDYQMSIWIESNDTICVNSGINNYRFHIWNHGWSNKLRAYGILSGYEFDNIKLHLSRMQKYSNLDLEIDEGKPGEYACVWGTSKKDLETANFNNTLSLELNPLIDDISDFIKRVDNFKQSLRSY